jgi:dihydrofolate reductase
MSASKTCSMKKRRKIIVLISISADGYIARPDGDVAWLDRKRPKGNYGFGAFFKSIDTILWGRKTYDKGIEMGMKASQFRPGVKNYVFSSTATLGCAPSPGKPRPLGTSASRANPLLPGFKWVNEPVKSFAQRLRGEKGLRAAAGKDIWMMGGGGIIASFLDAGEIDEFIIHVIPVLIGEGIPLLAPPAVASAKEGPRHRMIRLKLLASKSFPDGVVRLHYSVLRGS